MNAKPRALLLLMWRDTRANKNKLFVYAFGIFFGIAALVISLHVQQTLLTSLDEEAKSWLGADFVLRSKDDISLKMLPPISIMDSAKEVSFRSMASYKDEIPRIAQIRAIRGAFPFYGSVTTQPTNVWPLRSPGVMLDEEFLLRLEAKANEEISIGGKKATIAGSITNFPARSVMGGLIAPSIFVPYELPTELGLLGKESLVDYYLYLKIPDSELAATQAVLKQSLPQNITMESVADRKKRLGTITENMLFYTSLFGLTCLALGTLGTGVSLYFYLREKINDVAIFKCLGLTSGEVLGIFLLQLLLISSFSSAVAAVIGSIASAYAIQTLAGLFTTPLHWQWSWYPSFMGMTAGMTTILLVSIPAILILYTVTPLALLRGGTFNAPKNRLLAVIGLFIVAGVGVTRIFTPSWTQASSGIAAIGIGVGSIIFVGWILTKCVRAISRLRLPFVVRHGMLNIARPHNASIVLIGLLGITFALTATLMTLSYSLSVQAKKIESEDVANLFIYDVQEDEVAEVSALVKNQGFNVKETVPIILMRLDQLGNKKVSQILKDEANTIPEWTLNREYWVTFRNHMIENEELTQGTWIPSYANGSGSIPVSVDEGLAEKLGIGIGSLLKFEVQGVTFNTTVASLRKIHWESMQRNAFIVFPSGVLELVPKFQFLTVQTATPQASAQLQRALLLKFPGISVVDVRSVVTTISGIMDKISTTGDVFLCFLLGTSLSVLVGALISGKDFRLAEAALLSKLGATRKQIRLISFYEISILLLVSIAFGFVLSSGASYGVTQYILHTSYDIPWLQLFSFAAVLATIVLSIFVRGNREIFKD